MKKVILIVIILAALVTGLTLTVLLPNENLGPEQGEYVKPEQGEYENNVILVQFKEGPALEGLVLSPFGCVETGRPYIDFLNAKYHIDSMKPIIDNPSKTYKYGLDRWYKLESTKDFDVLNAVREYSLDPGVECAEPRGILFILPVSTVHDS
jgi:hypothetical protein